MAGLIRLIENNTISGKIAKEVLPEMFDTGKSAEEMLALLNERLPNDAATEMKIAMNEQNKITHIRLEKLLAT